LIKDDHYNVDEKAALPRSTDEGVETVQASNKNRKKKR